MEVAVLKDRKKELEEEILNLITEFEDKTDIKVKDVEADSVEVMVGFGERTSRKIHNINLELDL